MKIIKQPPEWVNKVVVCRCEATLEIEETDLFLYSYETCDQRGESYTETLFAARCSICDEVLTQDPKTVPVHIRVRLKKEK